MANPTFIPIGDSLKLREKSIVYIITADYLLRYKYKKQFSEGKFYFVLCRLILIYVITDFFLISGKNFTKKKLTLYYLMKDKTKLLVIISLILNIGIIGTLLFVKNMVESRLSKVSGMLTRLGNSEIDYTVHVEDTLEISTAFSIKEVVSVFVEMRVKYDLPFKAMIPVDQQIETPITLTVDKTIHLDTVFMFKNKIVAPLDEIISVDQMFTIPTNREKKKGINIPIVADIPLKQTISLDIKDPISVLADIPIKIPISETIPVKIELTIPVDINVPIDIPVKSEALITFPYQLPISGKIPLNLDIPVKIPLSATPIKSKSDSIAYELERLLRF